MIACLKEPELTPEIIALRAARIQQENMERVEDEEDLTRIDRRGGPKLLLVALIKNAVNTLEEWCRRYNNFHSRPYEFVALRKNAEAAYRYLMSDSREQVTSFQSACDETDADPQAIRDLIDRMDAVAIGMLAEAADGHS